LSYVYVEETETVTIERVKIHEKEKSRMEQGFWGNGLEVEGLALENRSSHLTPPWREEMRVRLQK
jgi:hypothetical protein